MPSDKQPSNQMGMFDLEADDPELADALNRYQYLSTAVAEAGALEGVIDGLLERQLPDPSPGVKRVNVRNACIIEYEIKVSEPKRKWSVTPTPLTEQTQTDPDANPKDPLS